MRVSIIVVQTSPHLENINKLMVLTIDFCVGLYVKELT